MTDTTLILKYLKYTFPKTENITKYYSYNSIETQKILKELTLVFSPKIPKDLMFLAIKEYIKTTIITSF